MPRRVSTAKSIIRGMVGRTLSEELYHAADKRVPRKGGKRVLSVQNLSMGKMVRNNSFSVYAGQITGVFGLIGSGRTETAKIVSGVYKRNMFHGGEVRLDGRSVRYRVPREAMLDGIVYVTEDRKLEGFFETMSIAENLYAGMLSSGGNARAVVSMGEMRALSEHWRRALNVRAIDGDARVVELSGGNQQKVVIAKSLVQKPRLIIFDEPTRGGGRRRHRRDPPAHQPARRRGLGHRRDLLLPARGDEPLRPHPGVPPRPRRGGVHAP